MCKWQSGSALLPKSASGIESAVGAQQGPNRARSVQRAHLIACLMQRVFPSP